MNRFRQAAQKNMSLSVSKDVPEGYVEEFGWATMGNVRTARTSEYKYAYFCHYKECNGWILGEPIEHEENSISPSHPLSGRQGTSYHCRRCGGEIGFNGMVS
jgi:hypothetical protein